ncbi:MAG: hypothetical protein COB08_007145 [Rhodobacteraceae bacterium]|nr:hypothetical protein [Paracoccaceae bacterium]
MFDFEELIAQMDPPEPWVEAFLQTLEETFSTSDDAPISNMIAVAFIKPLCAAPAYSALLQIACLASLNISFICSQVRKTGPPSTPN